MWLCTSAGLMDELRAAQKQISDLKSVAAQAQSQSLITQTETIAGGVKLLASEVADMDAKSLQVRQLPDKLTQDTCVDLSFHDNFAGTG